ncbi:MAG: bifunctional pyr operon transcriptional regulator/uracil phosphoribosyltransferase PyrR [Acidimicrobiales bacterium]
MTGTSSEQPSTATEFVPRSQVLSADEVARSLRRMSHEILEHHANESIVVIGLQTGGIPFADVIAGQLTGLGAPAVSSGTLDVAYWRDDTHVRPLVDATSTAIPGDLTDRVVVLVDDVLFTGRTIRAALNALSEWGRPRVIELAVMVDRGHRELPIRPDYVGKNLPTSPSESVLATLEGVWIGVEVAQ